MGAPGVMAEDPQTIAGAVVDKMVADKVVVHRAVMDKTVSKIESRRNKAREIERITKSKTRRSRSLRETIRLLVQVQALADTVPSQ